jgi:thiol-disulfide isomerase/thioredoxin
MDPSRMWLRPGVMRWGAIWAIALCTALNAGARAQAPKGERLELKTTKGSGQHDDPKARAAFDEVAKAYKALTAYSDHGKFTIATSIGGRSAKREIPLALTFVRPNKLDFEGDVVRVLCDGKIFTTSVIPLKSYTTAAAPEKIVFETFREGPLGAVLFGGLTAPPMYILAKLLTDADPASAMAQLGTLQLAPADPNAKDAKPAVPSILVDLPDEQPDLLLSIDPATKLLTAIDFKVKPKPAAKGEPPGQALTVEHVGWNAGGIATTVAQDRSFAYAPPKDFTRVESIGQEHGPAQTNPMLGKPAPDFTLTVLDGPAKTKTITKAELTGKVVVLDFWATWCGPCMKELPEIQKVIENYAQAGKDVVIVAVSQDSDPAEISELRKTVEKKLTDEKLSLQNGSVGSIALDPSAAVGGAFDVQAIPTLVILDGKGVVQSVHVGFDPQAATPFHKSLAHEIDTLLAGKSLAAPRNQTKKSARKEPTGPE